MGMFLNDGAIWYCNIGGGSKNHRKRFTSEEECHDAGCNKFIANSGTEYLTYLDCVFTEGGANLCNSYYCEETGERYEVKTTCLESGCVTCLPIKTKCGYSGFRQVNILDNGECYNREGNDLSVTWYNELHIINDILGDGEPWDDMLSDTPAPLPTEQNGDYSTFEAYGGECHYTQEIYSTDDPFSNNININHWPT
jgi:hypothetical protein